MKSIIQFSLQFKLDKETVETYLWNPPQNVLAGVASLASYLGSDGLKIGINLICNTGYCIWVALRLADDDGVHDVCSENSTSNAFENTSIFRKYEKNKKNIYVAYMYIPVVFIF